MQRYNTRVGGDVFFSGTFNGHSSGLAAALATIATLTEQPVHEHLFRLGDRMRAGLSEIVERKGYPCTVAGFGSVYTLYFMEAEKIENFSDVLRNDAALYINYRRKLMKDGVFELPMNLKRSHVSFSHTDADVDNSLGVAERALAETFADRARGLY